MLQGIKTIRMRLPLGLGSVNCYLAPARSGMILIDCGDARGRAALLKELAGAGCTPVNLKLVVLTHGDFDHCGNAAYLRKKYGLRIAMHISDAGMAEYGDMFWNRKQVSSFLRVAGPLLFRLPRADRFRPDVLLEDGADLTEFGWNAQILNLPGHSSGSLGILTAEGELFCGDLLVNSQQPGLNEIMDDPAAAQASVERLNGLGVKTVYPGHGESFKWGELNKALRSPQGGQPPPGNQ